VLVEYHSNDGQTNALIEVCVQILFAVVFSYSLKFLLAESTHYVISFVPPLLRALTGWRGCELSSESEPESLISFVCFCSSNYVSSAKPSKRRSRSPGGIIVRL
jgi:hypothetical protein